MDSIRIRKGDLIRLIVDVNYENHLIKKGSEYVARDVGIFYNHVYVFDENHQMVLELHIRNFEKYGETE